MSYNHKGTELQLPLTIESVEGWIEAHKKCFDLIDLDNPANLFTLQGLRAELYRDVLLVVKTNAGHAVLLAEAALKLEEILNQ
jgi:hypothetical protein